MTDKNYTDRRILRTRKFLRDALIEILKEKPISKITPTELCKRADINRNTFYSHYLNPEELLQTLEDDLLVKIKEDMLYCTSAKQTVTSICRTMQKHQALCEVLLTDHGNPSFSAKVFALANERNMRKISMETNQFTGNYAEMISNFTISGGSTILQIWVKNGMKEDPKELATFIEMLCIHGTSSMTR